MGYNDTPQYIVIKNPTTNLFNSQSLLQISGKSASIATKPSFTTSSTAAKQIITRPISVLAKNGASRQTPAFVKDIRLIKSEPGSSPMRLLSFSEIKTEPSSFSFRSPKRNRLGSLTPDEKLMRRKLKNRTAAQVSRDRRRRYVTDMEALVKQLKEENAKVIEINNKLNLKNEEMLKQNEELVQKNLHLYGSLASQLKMGNNQINGINMDFNPAVQTSLPAQHVDVTIQSNIFNQNEDIIENEAGMKAEVSNVLQEKEDNLSIDLLDLAVDTLDFHIEDYESDTDSGISVDFDDVNAVDLDDVTADSCDWDTNIIEDLFPDLTDF